MSKIGSDASQVNGIVGLQLEDGDTPSIRLTTTGAPVDIPGLKAGRRLNPEGGFGQQVRIRGGGANLQRRET